MRIQSSLLAFSMITIVSLASCKKEKDSDDNGNPPPALTILKNNNWKVAASLTREKFQGVLGGSFYTVSFGLQKQDELRWYLWFRDMSSFADPTEIILNTQNAVTINKPPAPGATDFRQFKTIYQGNTWEVHRALDGGNNFTVFKNNQDINISLGNSATSIKNLVASEDGLLNNSAVSGGSNSVSHYHYGTGQWKTNTFFATSFVSGRFNNRTYVVSLSKNTAQDGLTLLTETDNQQTSMQGMVYHEMQVKNHLAFSPVGFLLKATKHGDQVFVAIDGYQNKLEVYKVSLTDLTIQKVLDQPRSGANSDLANVEMDPGGNLYVVENRVENGTSHFSIRKYKATGGSEIILKEQDLRTETRIQGLHFFNGKLHAAIIYREEFAGNTSKNNYHMQLICPK